VNYTLRYTRYGALGLPEHKHELTGPRDAVAEEVGRLLDTMTPGDIASVDLRHDLPDAHPLAAA
jgi:hypothetical protein